MDKAVGHAAPAPSVRSRTPGLQARLVELLELERARGRSHGVAFRGAKTLIHVVEQAADRTKSRFTIELPTFIRGQFTATYEEYLERELEAPVQRDEVVAEK